MKPRELTYRRARSYAPRRVELQDAGGGRRAAPGAPDRARARVASSSVPRSRAIAAARTTSVVTWVTNVLDAATAISGPAWRNSTASASRVIAEPTVLVIATIGQPASRASRVGAIVSAVSPDWVTAMTSVRASSGGGSYRNSEPTVTRAGRPVQAWSAARADERRVGRRAAGDELDAVRGPRSRRRAARSRARGRGRRARRGRRATGGARPAARGSP